MQTKILHIAKCEKFIPPFIEILREHFDFEQHQFSLVHGTSEAEALLRQDSNVYQAPKSWAGLAIAYVRIALQMHQAEKVILHNLLNRNIVFLLFCMPWVLKKCYWVIWGADLYAYASEKKNWRWRLAEFFRRPVIRRLGHLVTFIKGDFFLARQWYGATGRHYECFMYPSNLYQSYDIADRPDSTLTILLGNSADPSNNHLEAFEKLATLENQKFNIYVPLSYGDRNHAQRVMEEGDRRFGDRFHPLTQMMPFSEYLDLLARVDIAVFNHKRQQAMGNTVSLLGLGKKVFMRSDVTQWQFFEQQGIKVFDIEQLETEPMTAEDQQRNMTRVETYFSMDNYLKQLQGLFA